jgi:hypothetical protein
MFRLAAPLKLSIRHVIHRRSTFNAVILANDRSSVKSNRLIVHNRFIGIRDILFTIWRQATLKPIFPSYACLIPTSIHKGHHVLARTSRIYSFGATCDRATVT